MKTTIAVIAFVTSAMFIIGCSVESFVAKGYVTAQTEQGYSINVGSAKGLQIGDVLQVTRQVNDKRTAITGKVRVTKILGVNSSIVELLTGSVQHGDHVEKWSR